MFWSFQYHGQANYFLGRGRTKTLKLVFGFFFFLSHCNCYNWHWALHCISDTYTFEQLYFIQGCLRIMLSTFYNFHCNKPFSPWKEQKDFQHTLWAKRDLFWVLGNITQNISSSNVFWQRTHITPKNQLLTACSLKDSSTETIYSKEKFGYTFYHSIKIQFFIKLK